MTKRRIAPPKALVEALLGARTVAMVTHINPDGDGLGSQAALAKALRSLGKAVVVANNDPTPAQYSFLGLDAFAGDPAGAELCVSLDCPVLERLGAKGKAAFLAAPMGAVIDHHVPKEPFGHSVWIADHAAATGEMIEALLPELGVALDAPMATDLYAALVNDTGCFRHSNSDAFTFACAVRLLEAGADSREVNRRLLDEKPLRQVRLQARVLDTMRPLAGGRAALVTVSAADLAAFSATWEDTDGLAETLRSIEGVEVGAMLREEGPLTAKLSLRSKFAFDVNAFARTWGGGGHAKAAGATLALPFGEAVKAVSDALDQAISAARRP
ncbi:MAG TPA: bifunctional oligoribonuclease/PAP phosphatase NrnA [bacterium]|nr:bifunctional oligoribonuclease/PAP phosphatase NrnA [bacterium]